MAKRSKSIVESFDIGYVVWEDAAADRTTSPKVDHKPYRMITAGIFVKRDGKGITVAQDVSEEGALRDKSFIPQAMVKTVKVLKKNIVRRSPQWVAFEV